MQQLATLKDTVLKLLDTVFEEHNTISEFENGLQIQTETIAVGLKDVLLYLKHSPQPSPSSSSSFSYAIPPQHGHHHPPPSPSPPSSPHVYSEPLIIITTNRRVIFQKAPLLPFFNIATTMALTTATALLLLQSMPKMQI